MLPAESAATSFEHTESSEMSCCVTDDHACHSDEDNHHQKNDCTDTGCPMNNSCHFQSFSSKLIHEIKSEETVKITNTVERAEIINNSPILIKELIYSIWNPPKYIS